MWIFAMVAAMACCGKYGILLWKVWDRIYDLGLVYENSHFAIEQRKAFLKREKIGVCDIVGAAYRDKIDASDLGMQQTTSKSRQLDFYWRK